MGFLEDRDLSGVPSIPEFYRGKTVFITGASGFMGKVLVEKLLYSCPDLDRIYILLRNKKGVKSEDRLAQILAAPLFDRLRKERPGFESQVFVIAGDVMELGLGISEEDRALIVNRVNIVYHVAASVRFDDPLEYAIRMNLRGTKEMVELAADIRNLNVFVHVSTSYANTNRETLEEIVYPPHADWRETLNICETTDSHTLKVLTPKFLGELPNTYTFSKQLAENVVAEYKGILPIVIIRPSIVISSVEEPVPGWIENFNGPAALLAACGKGILRSMYTDPDLVADYMPVDISIKSFIVASWLRGTKELSPNDDLPIYNCCAGKLNTVTMGQMIAMGRQIYPSVPVNDMLWTPGGDLTKSKTLHYIKVILLHLLPAIFVDTILWLAGRKPMLVKVQRRIYIANLALQYYITKQWTFDNTNLVLMRTKIKDEDRKHFYYEMENIDQYKYFVNAVKGGKKYLLKEKDEDMPKAMAHYKRMVVVDIIVQIVFYSALLWWFLNLNCIQNLISQIYHES
ncbi:putative fatty acyl-CoA reductase CG5065 isoform X1 [Spodoptera frugiperda]|uniref:Fatty acyl-CoA reductase n=1 Tax=Spodoptera frugiperda TaxID=7108 RepID=A0A9R0E385_SPOFR|nr:putative fatty acyl-CoA reductase CG5065 isoform X1 [Spodoptera frugiperda]